MMDSRKMVKAARDIKMWCSSPQFEDCCVNKVKCPFQVKNDEHDAHGYVYGCILKSKFPCDWVVPDTLDEWISRLDTGNADALSEIEQVEIKNLLVELKERREREDKELAERALEIERDDWEREE